MCSDYDDSAGTNDPISPDPRDSGPPPGADTETRPPVGTITGPPIGFSSGFTFSSRYEIQEEIGSGGFAVVYRARDLQIRREVALKILRADQTTPSSIRRLQREAALARDVESPHLIRIFELGEHLGLPYLALEFLPGGSLQDRIDEGPLPVAEVVRLGRDLLRGVGALHAAGVVHRDIKPGNVLFSAAGEAKLADLGVALPLDPNETRTTRANALVGTVDYLSPEQALGQDAGPRSDLYSLGVLLFEALTGSLPFPREEGVATLVSRLRSRPPSATRLRPEVPRWLARFLARLLEADPSRRYPSAEAALADLEANRGPLGVPWRRTAVASLLLSSAALVAWWLAPGELRFHRLRPITTPGQTGIEAVDRDGHVLWRKSGMSRLSTQISQPARLVANAPPSLVTIPFDIRHHSPSDVATLSVLDPETGAPVDQVALYPAANSPIPAFSNWFWPEKLAVTDLDGDGVDEILVSYYHHRSWPSFTVLYEPALHRTRLVYIASGHSSFELARDLDGDGHRDLLFSGMSSSLGSYPAIAAVRIRPWIGEEPARQTGFVPAASPGMDRFSDGRLGLLWFRLLRDPEFGQADHRLEFDDRLGAIRVPYYSRPVGLFSPRGARTEEPTLEFWGQPAPNAAEVAYLALEEAQRLAAGGETARAWQEISRGLDAARSASDSLLIECLRRFRAEMALSMLAQGRHDPAAIPSEALESIRTELSAPPRSPRPSESRFTSAIETQDLTTLVDEEYRRLVDRSQFPSEVAFDAARAFHLAGGLEAAVRWYRLGLLSRNRKGLGGQDRLFFVIGAVLALVELEQYDAALREIETFDATFGRSGAQAYDSLTALFHFFVVWRRGDPCPEYENAPGRTLTDTIRLIDLEWRWESRQDVATLLPAIDEELALASRTRGALLSLKSAVLLRQNRADEAVALAQEGLSLTRALASADTTARAFLPVSASRLEQARAAKAAEAVR